MEAWGDLGMRKKPCRDPDRSSAPTATSRPRRPDAFAAPAFRPLVGGRSEVDLEKHEREERDSAEKHEREERERGEI